MQHHRDKDHASRSERRREEQRRQRVTFQRTRRRDVTRRHQHEKGQLLVEGAIIGLPEGRAEAEQVDNRQNDHRPERIGGHVPAGQGRRRRQQEEPVRA